MEENDEQFVVEYILAVKRMSDEKWSRFLSLPCKSTQHVERGSVWVKINPEDHHYKSKHDTTRYLVKWVHLSYIHCSWEIMDDLLQFCKLSAIKALNSFINRHKYGTPQFSDLGINEFYPPEFVQIEKILDVVEESEDIEHTPAVPMLGLHSSNCAVTVKWRDLSHGFASFEDVADLQNASVSYEKELRHHRQVESQVLLSTTTSVQTNLVFGIEDSPTTDNIDIPSVFKYNNQLYNHQKLGVRWLCDIYRNRMSCVLADEPGLGKYPQIYAFLSLIKSEKPVMMILPEYRIHQVAIELRMWTNIIPTKYFGTVADRKLCKDHEFKFIGDSSKLRGFKPKCVLTTAECIKDFHHADLENVKWSVVVVDSSYSKLATIQSLLLSLKHVSMWIYLYSNVYPKTSTKLVSETELRTVVGRTLLLCQNHLTLHNELEQIALPCSGYLNGDKLLPVRITTWDSIGNSTPNSFETNESWINISVEKVPVSNVQRKEITEIFMSNSTLLCRLRYPDLSNGFRGVNANKQPLTYTVREYFKCHSRYPLSSEELEGLSLLAHEIRKSAIDARASWRNISEISLGDASMTRNRQYYKDGEINDKLLKGSSIDKSGPFDSYRESMLARWFQYSPKLSYLHNLLSTNPLKKIVIISQFRVVLDYISSYLCFVDRLYCRVDASMPLHDCFENVQKYSNAENKKILLLGLRPSNACYNTIGIGCVMPAIRKADILLYYDGLFDLDGNHELMLHHLVIIEQERSSPRLPYKIIRLISEGSIESMLYDNTMISQSFLSEKGCVQSKLFYLQRGTTKQSPRQFRLGWPTIPENATDYAMSDKMEVFLKECAINLLGMYNVISIPADTKDFWNECYDLFTRLELYNPLAESVSSCMLFSRKSAPKKLTTSGEVKAFETQNNKRNHSQLSSNVNESDPMMQSINPKRSLPNVIGSPPVSLCTSQIWTKEFIVANSETSSTLIRMFASLPKQYSQASHQSISRIKDIRSIVDCLIDDSGLLLSHEFYQYEDAWNAEYTKPLVRALLLCGLDGDLIFRRMYTPLIINQSKEKKQVLTQNICDILIGLMYLCVLVEENDININISREEKLKRFSQLYQGYYIVQYIVTLFLQAIPTSSNLSSDGALPTMNLQDDNIDRCLLNLINVHSASLRNLSINEDQLLKLMDYLDNCFSSKTGKFYQIYVSLMDLPKSYNCYVWASPDLHKLFHQLDRLFMIQKIFPLKFDINESTDSRSVDMLRAVESEYPEVAIGRFVLGCVYGFQQDLHLLRLVSFHGWPTRQLLMNTELCGSYQSIYISEQLSLTPGQSTRSLSYADIVIERTTTLFDILVKYIKLIPRPSSIIYQSPSYSVESLIVSQLSRFGCPYTRYVNIAYNQNSKFFVPPNHPLYSNIKSATYSSSTISSEDMTIAVSQMFSALKYTLSSSNAATFSSTNRLVIEQNTKQNFGFNSIARAWSLDACNRLAQTIENIDRFVIVLYASCMSLIFC